MDKPIYQIIRDMREDRDEKQQTLAKVLHITKQQYSLYETGKREFKIRHIVELCKYFHVSADYILNLPSDLPNPHRR